jgi:hypothetical protein
LQAVLRDVPKQLESGDGIRLAARVGANERRQIPEVERCGSIAEEVR